MMTFLLWGRSLANFKGINEGARDTRISILIDQQKRLSKCYRVSLKK